MSACNLTNYTVLYKSYKVNRNEKIKNVALLSLYLRILYQKYPNKTLRKGSNKTILKWTHGLAKDSQVFTFAGIYLTIVKSVLKCIFKPKIKKLSSCKPHSWNLTQAQCSSLAKDLSVVSLWCSAPLLSSRVTSPTHKITAAEKLCLGGSLEGD